LKQKNLRIALAVSVLALCVWGCRSQAGTTDNQSEPLQATGGGPRIKAPNFTLKDLKGQAVSLSDFKGKTVFLDFWATWCPPCVASTPAVDKLAQDYKDKNVVVLSISMDDEAGTVQSFVERKHLTNRVLMAADSGVNVHYQVDGIPSFFLIDKDGYFVASWAGYSPAMALAWRRELDHLLSP
jgi:peroxiredoxin